MLCAVSVPCLLPHGALQRNRRAGIRGRVERWNPGRRHAGDPLQVRVHCRSARLPHFRAGARSQTSARLPCFMTLAVERHRTTKIAVSSPFAYLTSGFMSALRVRCQQLMSAADLGLKHSDHRFTQLARTPAPTLIPLEMTGWRFFRGPTRKFHLSQDSSPSAVSRCDLSGSYAAVMNTKFMVLPYLYRLPYTNCRPCPLGF